MAITLGQSVTATNVSGFTTTTLTMPGAVTSGSALVAAAATFNGSAHTISASDDVNGAWSAADRSSVADDFGDRTWILSKANTGAGTPTITFTSTVSSTVAGCLSFVECKAVATSSHTDVGTSNRASSGNPGTTGTTGATAQADEIVWAVIANGNGTTTLTENGTGTSGTYTKLVEHEDGNTNVQSSIVYQILASTGTQVHTWTQTSVTYTASIETYKGGGGGGGGPTVKALAALGVG